MTAVVPERMRSDRVRRKAVRHAVASWARFALMVVVTVVLLSPVLPMFWRALVPGRGSVLQALAGAFAYGPTLQWLGNSALVSVAAVLVTVLVAAPAGYVLSRARGRSVGGFAIVLFALQALPVVIFIVPLFILFAQVGLTDSLPGITIIYVGIAVAVATWTMASAIDAIPVRARGGGLARRLLGAARLPPRRAAERAARRARARPCSRSCSSGTTT